MTNNHFNLSLTSTQQIYLTCVLLAVCCQPVRWLMKNCHRKQSIRMEDIARCKKMTTNITMLKCTACLCVKAFHLSFRTVFVQSQLNTKTQPQDFPADRNKLLIPVLLAGEKWKQLLWKIHQVLLVLSIDEFPQSFLPSFQGQLSARLFLGWTSVVNSSSLAYFLPR